MKTIEDTRWRAAVDANTTPTPELPMTIVAQTPEASPARR